MNLIRFVINRPVTVVVGIILVILFGFIGILSLPVQLSPDIQLPKITVSTTWPGASPNEIEVEIIDKQEEKLKDLRGLQLMESSSYNDMGEITLTFNLGMDVDTAMLRVSNKLSEVSDYPENADEPVIDASGAQGSPIIWMTLQTLPDNERHIDTYKTFFDDEIKPYFSRIEGVGNVMIFGGTAKQLEIVTDADQLARNSLSIPDVANKVTIANNDIPAGIMGIGKSNYRIRSKSKFETPEEPNSVVIRSDGINTVRLNDLAETRIGYEPQLNSIMHNKKSTIVMGITKQKGSNVLEITERVKTEMERLNGTLLRDKGVMLNIVHEQTPYITTAIKTVQTNIIIGGLLAIVVLILFLRSFSSTITTAIALPISAIGTFIFLSAFGRSLNVVSLAGISFAIGMLVDNAIVVLENIDRHRKMGKKPFDACQDGVKEVWSAVFTSTTTTVVVFLPIIFMQQEVGQLFKDIAIAITFAIILSFIVSVLVIPSVAYQFFKVSKGKKQKSGIIGRIGMFFVNIIMFFSRQSLRNYFTRFATVISLLILSLGIVYWLMPEAEYLPQGNQNIILNILVPPPGLSYDKKREIGDTIYEKTDPYFKEDYKDGIPQIKEIFYIGADRLTLFGATSAHETEAKKMIPLFNRIINEIPDMAGVSLQVGIFQDDISEGRTVKLDVMGSDISKITNAARQLYGAISQKIPGAQIRPVPSLEVNYPEVNIKPDRKNLAANGFNERDLGIIVDSLMDGHEIGDYKPSGVKAIDLVIRGEYDKYRSPESILDSTIATRNGDLIKLKDMASLEYTKGVSQINHLERKRVVSLEVTPPEDVPLQTAMDIIEYDVVEPMRSGEILAGLETSLGGNADKLSLALQTLSGNFILAVIIVYLLMAAIFENFFYPFIILFTVPLAAAGGFAGLKLVNIFIEPQAFDVLTMLGFIILVGTVVNNAILIVYQTLENMNNEQMSGLDSILEAVQTRIRPIFMSMTTSFFGMLPLVLAQGSGTELYRGIGSVLLGGLTVSTIFTLFVIPSLLGIFIGHKKGEN